MAFRGCAGVTGRSDRRDLRAARRLRQRRHAAEHHAVLHDGAGAPISTSRCGSTRRACRTSTTPQAEWAHEKGAIEQEVARDLSEPTYKFMTRLNEDLFAGTPYAHDALGTHESFETTTGDMLKTFYKNWYAPNNAILVVAGDVDPATTLARIKELYGSIPRRPLPSRPEVIARPVKHESFTLDSNLPYTLAFIAYRLPGTDSPDFAAARVLADVLASQRGDLYALGARRQGARDAVRARGNLSQGQRRLRRRRAAGWSTDPSPVVDEHDGHRRGLRAERRAGGAGRGGEAQRDCRRRVSSAIRSRISRPPGRRRSPPKAATRRTTTSTAIRRVTVADVNRVAKQYLVENNSITATLVPKPSDEPVVVERIRRRRATDVGADQAGHAARLGRRRAVDAASPARRSDVDRHDAAERAFA